MNQIIRNTSTTMKLPARFCMAFLFMLTTFLAAQAQDNIKNEEVDVVKAYQPLLADAEKISFHAEPSAIDTVMQPLQYDVKPHVTEPLFTPAEIRPVALPKEEAVPMLSNILKAGFGSQLTPLVELHLAKGRSDKVTYGLNLHHLSSNASKIDFQDVSHTGADLFGSSYFKGVVLSGAINYDRDVHYFYGTYSDSTDSASTFDKDFLQQKFENFGVNLGLKNAQENKAGIDYHFNFHFNDFERRAGDTLIADASENYYRLEAGLAKTIRKIHSANLDFNWQQENFSSLSDTVLNTFSILPNYQLHDDKLDFKGGVNVLLSNGDVKVYPDLFGSYKVIGDYLIPYAGFHSTLDPVTMQSISLVNPFIGNLGVASDEVLQAYAGLKGSYGYNLSYNLKVSYTAQSDLPVYLPSGIPTHYVVDYYEDARIVTLHAEVGFKQSEHLNLLLSGETNSYDLDYNDQPWGLPKSKLALDINYNLQNKIFFDVNLFGQTGTYVVLNGDTTQRKGFVDANLETTYNYKKNIAFWFSLSNIAAMKEREWYNYPFYGFQALAGIKLKF